MKRLILAPHADDEVLGCGGLLAKYPDECSVVIAAGPSKVRKEECIAAKDLLGYNHLTLLLMQDGQLSTRPQELVKRFDELLSEIRPDELYLPYPDLHQDHIAVYEAGMRSARASMSAEHWYVPNVFVYDVAAYTLELRPTGLKFDTFEDISGDPVLAKGKAMECYVSESPPPPCPGNGDSLVTQAKALGGMHRRDAVEQYAAVRVLR